MKRAEVWRMWPGSWGVILYPASSEPDRSDWIRDRSITGGVRLRPGTGTLEFPTHADALTAALASVGLTKDQS